MLKNIIISILLFFALTVLGLLYLEAKDCADADKRFTQLEVDLLSREISVIREAKELCEQHVAATLNAQKLGFEKITAYQQGTTQLYRDVRVGVFGTSGGNFAPPALKILCLTDLESRKILRIEETSESFDESFRKDAHAELKSEMFRTPKCNADIKNPFYKFFIF